MNFSKYIKLPYKNLGREFDGVDCAGLLFLIYREERGIDLPDFTEINYPIKWYENANYILDNVDKCITDRGYFVPVNTPYRIFDALIFFNRRLVANHIGMFIGDGKFIHILEDSVSEIQRLDHWKHKLYAAMRWTSA